MRPGPWPRSRARPLAQDAADAVAPEAGTEATAPDAFADVSEAARAALDAKAAGEPVRSQEFMVAAANPLAVEAGARVLREGGTAADAMVAVQAVLGLVEPQSSGLGGGAFLVWHDGETGEMTTLDGRETAPMAATPTLFQGEDGEPLEFFEAVVGGLSVGTPGTPMLLQEAHERWGTQEWPTLLQDAIDLAENGFAVSPRLAQLVAEEPEDRLPAQEAAAAYFYPGGEAIEAGDTLVNQDYADTLRALAEGGAEAFYEGEIAQAIVETVQGAPNPGLLAAEDLAAYGVVERPPVCVEYRDAEVCGMGPPSSGALTVGQILGMLGSYDLAGMGPESADAWRLIGDASRLAFADRGRYMADTDFVPVPTEGLVAPEYLAFRATLLGGDDALPEVSPGEPHWDHARLQGDDASLELPSTSHISIVDGAGNALSMTTTIENGFGSRLFTHGFLLNNELTDFSFETHEDGWPIANRVEPGKRPRSSMAPTIVTRDGEPRAGRGLAGRLAHHRLRGAGDRRPSRLGPRRAAGRGPAPPRRPLRHLRHRGGHVRHRPRRAAPGDGLRDRGARPRIGAPRHRAGAKRPHGRRRPAARGHRAGRVTRRP